VAETLNGIDRETFERAVGFLVDPSRTIVLISGDASAGIATSLSVANGGPGLRLCV